MIAGIEFLRGQSLPRVPVIKNSRERHFESIAAIIKHAQFGDFDGEHHVEVHADRSAIQRLIPGQSSRNDIGNASLSRIGRGGHRD